MPKLFKEKTSFFRAKLQQFVANMLFPSGQGDWYAQKGYGKNKGVKKPDVNASFNDFKTQQTKPGSKYFDEFDNLNLNLKLVPSRLTTGDKCSLEVMTCSHKVESDPAKPGTGKHIIYFPGANTYYQACFRDISAAAKETGASVHAFNFPGTGVSTGKVREANDLINAGIAVTNQLIRQGVHPDDIILQGDCYGAGIALEVKKQFSRQSNIKLRMIMNNAFKSFKSVIIDAISSSRWLPNFLKSIVKNLLTYTGWHVTPGKSFGQSGPYQCYIQHLGDRTLQSSTLASKVKKYRHEMVTNTTKSKKRMPKADRCPEEYREKRDKLEAIHCVRVKSEAEKRLGKKFGKDEYGNINPHFADLGECETLDGKSAYTGFVNVYLEGSNQYIASHRQDVMSKELPEYIGPAQYSKLSRKELAEVEDLADYLENGDKKEEEKVPLFISNR